MSTFTIDAENNIVAHTALPAGADEAQSFASEKELAKLTAEWPMSRLADTWMGLRKLGIAPVATPTLRYITQPRWVVTPRLLRKPLDLGDFSAGTRSALVELQ
jgi:hypothetical protein